MGLRAARLALDVPDDPAAFRRVGNRVELRGEVVNTASEAPGDDEGSVVFTLPEGYRPPAERQFPVGSERGPTLVTVMPDGSVIADPSDGWISLNGISFETEGPPTGS